MEKPLEIRAEITAAAQDILTEDALAFIATLVERYGERVDDLLKARADLQRRFDAGHLPDFLPETAEIRATDWKVAPIPPALEDRRVEITGPAEPKMIINALNSGAKVFMACMEDALSPTWERMIEAQIALKAAAHHELRFTSPEGKHYVLNDEVATLIMRPRGWHLPEKHVFHNGNAIPGALLDFGLFFFHNARHMAEKGTGPFFYLPKLEHHTEAALWADIFAFSEDFIGISPGTVRATVLIETITAVFEMDEILYALRSYIAGLNCGRWDYIFSYIKKFNQHADFVLPDRSQVVMSSHFLKAYSELLIQTCHRRGAFAMGGMAPHIPIKGDAAANEAALTAVKKDKEREASWGHDGTWVAHPGLISLAMEVFDRLMPQPNQLMVLRDDVSIRQEALLEPHKGTITEAGLRNNANVCIQYTAAWLTGVGCVPLNHLMEDAATAEIARAQLWQWAHHTQARLEDGSAIDIERISAILAEELEHIREDVGADAFAKAPYERAKSLIDTLTRAEQFTEFLTLPAYEQLD